VKELFLIFVGSVLVNNFVLTRFLGICPFLGVSKEVETAFGMGLATTFVMTFAGVITWLIQNYLLIPFNLPYLQYVAFILVIASLVQFLELFLQKTVPALHSAFGIFLPLITTNCAILGLALLIALNAYDLVTAFVFSFGAGVGFTLAITVMAGIRQQLDFGDVPASLRGPGIALLIAGMLSLVFMGFSGLVAM